MFPITDSRLAEIITETGISDIASATIRQICALAAALEREAGEKFVHLEMGNPGIGASEIGVAAECEVLRGGIANKYPDISGLPKLKKAGADFLKAFVDIDVDPRGIVPTVGSMQGLLHHAPVAEAAGSPARMPCCLSTRDFRLNAIRPRSSD